MDVLDGTTHWGTEPSRASPELEDIATKEFVIVCKVHELRAHDPRSRMREIRTSGSVGGRRGNPPADPTLQGRLHGQAGGALPSVRVTAAG